MGRDIKLMTGPKGHKLFMDTIEAQALANVEQDMANNLLFGTYTFKTTETKLLELVPVIKSIPTQHHEKIIQLAGSNMEDDQNLARALITKYVSNLNEIAEKAGISLKEEKLFSDGLWQQLNDKHATPYVKNPNMSFKYQITDFSEALVDFFTDKTIPSSKENQI